MLVILVVIVLYYHFNFGSWHTEPSSCPLVSRHCYHFSTIG